MAKSNAHEALEKAYNGDLTNWSNPGNSDKVNIALGLLSAESADKLSSSIKDLQGQIAGLGYVVSTTIEQQSAKIITSNEKLATSNEKYAKANNRLALALIAVTLIVGLLQVYAILRGH